jgi:hypothetical protein
MGLTRPRAAQIYDIDYKQSVRVITTSNITLSGGAPTVVDGVTLSLNDRILVSGQSTGSQNGIYIVSVLGTGSNGTWIRSTDTNATGELDSGTIVMVTEGSAYADTSWKLTTNDPIVIGTTALTFEINTGNAFGTISANGTSVVANSATGTVTFSTGNNIVITGNAATDTITFAVRDNPSFSQTVSATGNITGGNLTTAGTANIGTLAVTGLTTLNGNTTIGGHVLPSANISYDLGSPTQRWRSIYVGANTIDIGGATISANLTTGSLILTGPDGGEFILTGNSPTTSDGNFGFLTIGSNSAATSTTTGAVQVLGGMGLSGNIFAGGIVDIAGNSIYLGNLVLKDNGSNIFGLYAADGTTPATISQSSVDTTKISNGTSNVQVVAANANVTISVGGTSNVIVASTAGANVTGNLGVTGNAIVGNLNLSGNIVDTGALTLITGSSGNVSLAPNGTNVLVTTTTGANVTGTLNATGAVSAGTLTVSGNATIAGNLTVSGNVISVNVTDLNVVDPIIGLGRGPNNTPLTTNDGKDRGEQLWYYTTSEQSAFIGYDNSAGKLIAATNVSVSSEVVTVNNYGNFIVGGLEATTISSSGNANVGNLGTAGQVTATGNVTGSNLTTAGNITGNYLLANITFASGYNTTKLFNGTSEANIGTSGGNLAITIGGTPNVAVFSTAGGNVTGNLYATGNVFGGNILGNGRNLSGIETFRSFAVASGNTIVADSINDTFTFNAGSGITIVADPTTDTLTIATSGSGSEIFVDGADFGTVTEVVTLSDDLGLVTEAVTSQSDLGEIVTSGVFYPTQLVLPSYTVSTLPNATIPAQFIYVSNATGGAITAFSDGTNWRRTSDRSVIN